LERDEAGDELGAALSAADLDGDGIDDLAVGAPGKDHDRGAVYLFRGSRRGLVATQVLRSAARSTRRLGHSLTALGWSEDQPALLAAGAPASPENPAALGAVELWRGSSAAEVSLVGADELIEAPAAERRAGDGFGWSLALVPARADAQLKLVVGAPFDAGAGAVHVFTLPEPQARGAELRSYVVRPGSGAAEQFGTAVEVSRIAGPDTLAVGAPSASAEESASPGRVYLLRLEDDGANLLQTVLGTAAKSGFGSPVLAFGRWALMNQLLVAAPKAPAAALLRVRPSFDDVELEYRALMPVPVDGAAPARALARGDFDGNGALDVALGWPDDDESTGGSFGALRQLDDGSLIPWGRYRQSD
jgi:hypothetical protein